MKDVYCLKCNEKFKSDRSLTNHIKKVHGFINRREYDIKYDLIKKCGKCGKELIKTNQSGFCNVHRNRTGKNNPMFGKSVYEGWVHKYGKKIADEKKLAALEKNKIASKKLWEDDNYRNAVITNSSKPRHENFKIEQSKRIKQWYVDNPEQRKIRSISLKKKWEDGVITGKNTYSWNSSKGECELREMLIAENLWDVINTSIKYINEANDKKWLLPDIMINDKIVIEYNGDYWHANPTIYVATDILKFSNNTVYAASEIWKRDENRYNIIKSKGYVIIVVWEKDFKENKNNVLQKVKHQIMEILNEQK